MLIEAEKRVTGLILSIGVYIDLKRECSTIGRFSSSGPLLNQVSNEVLFGHALVVGNMLGNDEFAVVDEMPMMGQDICQRCWAEKGCAPRRSDFCGVYICPNVKDSVLQEMICLTQPHSCPYLLEHTVLCEGSQ
jgi:hypothetical protein